MEASCRGHFLKRFDKCDFDHWQLVMIFWAWPPTSSSDHNWLPNHMNANSDQHREKWHFVCLILLGSQPGNLPSLKPFLACINHAYPVTPQKTDVCKFVINKTLITKIPCNKPTVSAYKLTNLKNWLFKLRKFVHPSKKASGVLWLVGAAMRPCSSTGRQRSQIAIPWWDHRSSYDSCPASLLTRWCRLHRCSQRKGLGIGKGVVGSFWGGFQRLEIGEVSSHMVFHFKLAKKWWLMTCFPNVQLFCNLVHLQHISKGRVGPDPSVFSPPDPNAPKVTVGHCKRMTFGRFVFHHSCPVWHRHLAKMEWNFTNA